jgi:hypothetical protein
MEPEDYGSLLLFISIKEWLRTCTHEGCALPSHALPLPLQRSAKISPDAIRQRINT